jgi:NADH-quinone oxidoreductase subunit L
MEGPTPVSALIHAATMVTAGVYVVARSHILFEHSETALIVVGTIGCATAFFAATIGLVQTDIKKVLAYSTVSQLGYMFMACGVGAFSAGIFHLMTHAFFKALLFLAAGSVIHAMGGEQDMRQMGGLRKKIKYTFATMFIATLAIAGIPPLAAFFSKDSILLAAYQREGGMHPLYYVGLLTALLTSFYMFRLVFLTFWGEQRYDEHHVHVHESPWSMLGPLVVLAILSICGGWFAAPALWGGKDYFTGFLAPVFAAGESANPIDEVATHNLEMTLAIVAVLAALLGIAVAYWLYVRQPRKPEQLAKSLKPVYTTLYNKYYVDELYAAAIVRPLVWLSENVLWKVVDVEAIDGTVNGIAHGATATGDALRHTQSGNARSYAVWVVIGALAIIVIIFWPAAHPVLGTVSK